VSLVRRAEGKFLLLDVVVWEETMSIANPRSDCLYANVVEELTDSCNACHKYHISHGH
jgi:hypothetical protein